MGFARLHFVNSGSLQVGNVIRDICGVISGSVTDTSGLIAATQNLSEIRNSAGRGNWTQLYPNTLSNTVPRVLSATCLNGQTKFIQIGHMVQGSGIFGTANTTLYGTSGLIVFRSCTSASSSTSISDATFVHTGQNPTNSVGAVNGFGGTILWISWSSRHCLIIGNAYGSDFADVGASGCFEFNETGIYDYRNAAPFLHCQWFLNDFDTTNNTPAQVNGRRSSVIILNHYRTDTGVATGAYNLSTGLSNVAEHSIITHTAGSFPTSFTKNSSGASAIYLQPLFYHQHQMGIPHHYISDLSKVYRVQSGIGNNGDLLTVGADTYAYFNLTASLPSGVSSFALAVLRE